MDEQIEKIEKIEKIENIENEINGKICRVQLRAADCVDGSFGPDQPKRPAQHNRCDCLAQGAQPEYRPSLRRHHHKSYAIPMTRQQSSAKSGKQTNHSSSDSKRLETIPRIIFLFLTIQVLVLLVKELPSIEKESEKKSKERTEETKTQYDDDRHEKETRQNRKMSTDWSLLVDQVIILFSPTRARTTHIASIVSSLYNKPRQDKTRQDTLLLQNE